MSHRRAEIQISTVGCVGKTSETTRLTICREVSIRWDEMQGFDFWDSKKRLRLEIFSRWWLVAKWKNERTYQNDKVLKLLSCLLIPSTVLPRSSATQQINHVPTNARMFHENPRFCMPAPETRIADRGHSDAHHSFHNLSCMFHEVSTPPVPPCGGSHVVSLDVFASDAANSYQEHMSKLQTYIDRVLV